MLLLMRRIFFFKKKESPAFFSVFPSCARQGIACTWAEQNSLAPSPAVTPIEHHISLVI